MRNEEMEFVKFIINKLEQKHTEIQTLAVDEALANAKIETVRDEWNKKYGTLHDQVVIVKENYKRDGFICEESKTILENI